MLLEEKYELFEQKMQNTLTAEDAAKLDLLLQQDKDAAEEMTEYIAIQEQLEAMTQNQQQKNAFINNLKKIAVTNSIPLDKTEENTKLLTTATTSKFSFAKNAKWIAAFAALIVIGIFMFKNLSTPQKSMEQLFASNYTAEPLSNERGAMQDSLQQIIDCYSKNNYNEAIPLMEWYTQKHPEKTDLLLATAICNIELKNTDKAIAQLQTLISANTIYTEKAQWYLAMAYLQKGDQQNVKSLLLSFNKEHFYYSKAQNILANL